MKIVVAQDPYTYAVYLDEDGEFHCPHDNIDVEYDRGGDGRTEPGPSWSVYCNDCHNDDMADSQVDGLVDAYISAHEPDPDHEYEHQRNLTI